jgi:GrpB-like predicted nucleotidyltransferase (UPF0157 family)
MDTITKMNKLQLYFEFFIDYLYSFTISNTETITLLPYNPHLKKIATKVINQIHTEKPDLKVELLGSTAFEIEGQYDIDMVAECEPSQLKTYLPALKKILGKPHKKRAYFVEWLLTIEDCSIEFCLMDPSSYKYQKRMLIYRTIKNSTKLIEEYRDLKLRLNGSSLRMYEQERQKFFLKIILDNS